MAGGDLPLQRDVQEQEARGGEQSRLRSLGGEELLRQLPHLQRLLSRLTDCKPAGAAALDPVVQVGPHACSCVGAGDQRQSRGLTPGRGLTPHLIAISRRPQPSWWPPGLHVCQSRSWHGLTSLDSSVAWEVMMGMPDMRWLKRRMHCEQPSRQRG